jgi:crotonobetainyl-CoA:carnitine CoA-transferase CaiB-like acyl-CoA transferase
LIHVIKIDDLSQGSFHAFEHMKAVTMTSLIKPNASETGDAFPAMLSELWSACGGRHDAPRRITLRGFGNLPSAFDVSDLAAASIAVAGLAVSEWIAARSSTAPSVDVDRRLASFWFATSLRPEGWKLPSPWDPIAGDYPTSDGWIRLHTNAKPHRAAALAVLGVQAEPEAVARGTATWQSETLEAAIVAAGGCAAAMRSLDDWAAHPQGRAVAEEPLVHWSATETGPGLDPVFDAARPLAGIRVLDLTRVLAGPVATRFLAGFGAEVLRIDPPDWDEPALVPEVMIGKRTGRLDLRREDDFERLRGLLREADVLIHGYRADALERLGLASQERRKLRPGLVDVSLDAYGWTGPWRNRRGFDSLVQMSTGVAEAGMLRFGKVRPTPLPVQALDHATGYLMAAGAVLGLLRRLETGCGCEARTSLARMGFLLARHAAAGDREPLAPETSADLDPRPEMTPWGPARRLRAPVDVAGAPLYWQRGAAPIGSDPPKWA